jgi:RNA polymerase sigma factor (TIGR02999 family)
LPETFRTVILARMSDVTQILSAIEQGDPHAAAQLWPLVYDELHRLAAQKLARERPSQSLQATGLVHEAYLRLVAIPGGESDEAPARWECRGHFFAAAAEAMRRILIDQARRKHSAKRGGDRRRLTLDELASYPAPEGTPPEDLLALDEALRQLEAEEPVKARLVKLRYFAGVSLEDAARMLGVSPGTAKRYWVYARSWLYGKLHGQ